MKRLLITALACCSFACPGKNGAADAGTPNVVADAAMTDSGMGGCNVDPASGAIIVPMACVDDVDCNATCGDVCVGGETSLCITDDTGSSCYCRP